MYGAPPKPTRGVEPSSATTMRTASEIGASASGSSGRSFRTSDAVRIGSSSTGPRPGDDPHSDAREQHRHDDVAEEHGRVDAVPAHRLQGDLGGERRVEAGVEHLGARADRPVLRQRAPRLTHEPHRQRVGAVTARGADEGRMRRAAVGERMGGRQGAHRAKSLVQAKLVACCSA